MTRASPLIPLLLALAWGLNCSVVKIVLSAVPPFNVRWIGLGGGALLLPLLALARRASLMPERSAWPGILVGGTLTIAAFNFCTAFAQLSTSTSRAAVLTYTMPRMAAALAWTFLGERPGAPRRAGPADRRQRHRVLAWPVLRAPALAYVLWYRLLDSLSATVSSLTTLAVPVVGVLGAMALVGERPGPAD